MAPITGLLLMLVLVSRSAIAVPSCPEMGMEVFSCIPFLTGFGGAPSGECCSGVVAIKNSLQTTLDLQTACQCLKNAVTNIPALKADRVTALPPQCGVNIDVPISPYMDCSKIREPY